MASATDVQERGIGCERTVASWSLTPTSLYVVHPEHDHRAEDDPALSTGNMDPTNATIPAGLNIATAVHEVARGFIVLANAFTPNSRFKVTPALIQDELCRFKLWAGNIAAHRTGSRSLEYR